MASNSFSKLLMRVRVLRRAYKRSLNEAYQEELLAQRFPHVIFGRSVVVRRPDRFYPGKGVFIHDLVYLNCAGTEWNNRAGFIRIGDNTEVAPFVAIWGAGEVTIGNNVHVGDHTTLTAHASRQIQAEDRDVWKPLEFDFGPIVIEDHVIIGSHVTITPGVRIGQHALVGAGSVVIRDVPAYCVVAGVPARVIRELPHDETGSDPVLSPLATPPNTAPASVTPQQGAPT